MGADCSLKEINTQTHTRVRGVCVPLQCVYELLSDGN